MIMWSSETENRRDKRHESQSIVTANDSHSFTGFSEDAFYVFWVVAINEFGSSDPSDQHDFEARLESIQKKKVIEVWLIVLIVICAVIFLLICCACCFFCLFCCYTSRQRVYFAEKEGTGRLSLN